MERGPQHGHTSVQEIEPKGSRLRLLSWRKPKLPTTRTDPLRRIDLAAFGPTFFPPIGEEKPQNLPETRAAIIRSFNTKLTEINEKPYSRSTTSMYENLRIPGTSALTRRDGELSYSIYQAVDNRNTLDPDDWTPSKTIGISYLDKERGMTAMNFRMSEEGTIQRQVILLSPNSANKPIILRELNIQESQAFAAFLGSGEGLQEVLRVTHDERELLDPKATVPVRPIEEVLPVHNRGRVRKRGITVGILTTAAAVSVALIVPRLPETSSSISKPKKVETHQTVHDIPTMPLRSLPPVPPPPEATTTTTIIPDTVPPTTTVPETESEPKTPLSELSEELTEWTTYFTNSKLPCSTNLIARVDPRFAPVEGLTALRQAISDAEQITNRPITLIEEPFAPSISKINGTSLFAWHPIDDTDNPDPVTGKLSNSTLYGLPGVSPDGIQNTELIYSSTVFNKNEIRPITYYHELFHTLGLGHVDDYRDIMFGGNSTAAGRTSNLAISTGDRRGLIAVSGC